MEFSICEALPMSVCLPQLWAHHQPGSVWQCDMNSLAIPSHVRIACWTKDMASVVGCGQLQPSTPKG